MKTIHRRLRKLEEGLGLIPQTEEEKRLRARLEAARARLAACGYQITEPDENELRGMTISEILQRGRQRARLRGEQLKPEVASQGATGVATGLGRDRKIPRAGGESTTARGPIPEFPA